MKEKKNKQKSKKSKKASKKAFNLTKRQKIALLGFIALIILIVFILSLSKGGNKNTEPQTAYEVHTDEPQFQKEGELYFIRQESGDTIKKIAIEIADNYKDREQGLMYRSTMADSLGMLFIFDRAEEQSFWMKNTKLTLDILYVDDSGKILTLHKYTKPYSEEGIPSYEKARYVVEVVGGFTDRYKIDRGDEIRFERQDLP